MVSPVSVDLELCGLGSGGHVLCPGLAELVLLTSLAVGVFRVEEAGACSRLSDYALVFGVAGIVLMPLSSSDGVQRAWVASCL